MKEGELLLNWQKKPVAILLCNETNKVFWFKDQTQRELTNKQMNTLFFSEEGLSGANLIGANLIDADLRGANLRGADLSYAYLYRADLRGANLEGAHLRGAHLRGANLYGANLYGAILRNATYNRYNIWPDGFDKSRLFS